jgi:hypothetical protein
MLADGEHWTVADNGASAAESLDMWMADAEPGDEVTIKLVEMSDKEVAALPDI